MATIQFYHLLTTPIEQALPKLLEKALSAGYRCLLTAESEDRIEQLNQLLWTYDPGSFLPHASVKDGQPEEQPVLLSTALEAPNDARLLAVTDGRLADAARFERVLDIFDGNSQSAVEQARIRWKTYKEQGNNLSYLRQTATGGWEQKAVA